MHAHEFVARLDGVKKAAGGWIARCPAHDDKNPSLKISESDGKILINCHAGCTADAIVTALGLSMKDLFTGNGNGTGKGETRPIIATHGYTDSQGHVLCQKARFATKPKTKPRHKDPNGKWVWGAGTDARPLYHLPEILKAQEVCFTEGEKDADALTKLGFQATCLPFGKWEREHIEAMAGKDLFIFWDNDDPGRKKRDDAVQALQGAARSVRVVDLPTDEKPEGYDVSDFITEQPDHEAAAERLAIFMSEAKSPPKPPSCIISAGELLALDIPTIRWAVKNIIPEGLALLAGKPKMGKSILALNLCIAVALGTKALGYADTERGTVLYLALEDVKRRLKSRLAQCLTGESAIRMIIPEKLMFATEWPRMGAGGLQKLEKELAPIRDMKMVVIDTLKMIRPIEKDTNKRIYDLDYEPIQRLKSFADRHGIAVVLVHHLRKSAGEDVMDTMSGSFGLTGASDTNIVLTRSTGLADAKLHIVGRDIEAAEYAMKFNPDTLSWNIMGYADQVLNTDAQQKILDAFPERDELSRSEIIDVTGLRQNYVSKMLNKLIKDGVICKSGRGRYALSTL
jgi:archaellum biogenesis ATPase FlaH